MSTVKDDCLKDEARFHRILGDQSRLALAIRLLEGEAYVGELAEVTKLSGSRVSQLLQGMRDGGLVDAERQGVYVYYTLRPEWKDAVEEVARRCSG